MTLLVAACDTPDAEEGPAPAPEVVGACLSRSHDDGPQDCENGETELSCSFSYGGGEFRPNLTCSEAGFDFCCRTGESQYGYFQFASYEDALWFDEFSAYPDDVCAPNPVPCEDASGGSSSSSGGGSECSSNASCPSGQACKSGQCVSVECTSDSHCGNCERCSGNSCVYCGEGPYGCYC